MIITQHLVVTSSPQVAECDSQRVLDHQYSISVKGKFPLINIKSTSRIPEYSSA